MSGWRPSVARGAKCWFTSASKLAHDARMTDERHVPTDLPVLHPDPEEMDIAEPGDGSEPPKRGWPRLDVARKLARQVCFLQHFRQCGVITEACRRTGVSRRLVYQYWRQDPVFEAAFREALEEAADVIEAEMYRRGVEGVDEPVVHQGMPTYLEGEGGDGERRMWTIKKYSEGCLLALAKARRPERFRDNHKVEHSGAVVSGVLVVPAAVDPDSWEQAAEDQQARFRPEGHR